MADGSIAPASSPRFLQVEGEMGGLIARFNWSRTSLGPISQWSATLRGSIATILRSPRPIVTLWGKAGVMIYNDAYAILAGVRHPELLGLDVRDAWPELADFNDNVVKVVLGGGTLSYRDQEFTLDRDGAPRKLWSDLDYSPIVDEDGRPVAVLVTVVETTDRVLADRRVKEESNRLEQMFRQSPSFMALLEGPDHRFSLYNPAYSQLIDHRDVLGKTLGEALPDMVAQGYLDLLDSVYRSGQAFMTNGARYSVQAQPGGPIRERFVDFVFQPIRNAEGEVNGIFIDGVDVSEYIAAREAIAASAQQFRTFAEAMPNHVWTTTPEGHLNWFNQRTLDYTGKSTTILSSKDGVEIVHPDDRQRIGKQWKAAVKRGETFESEFRIRNAEGDYRWHLVRALPLRSETRKIVRWIGTNTDIHDQKQVEAEHARDRDRLWTMSRDLMMVCDYQGVIKAVNPSAMRLLGWTQAEMVGAQLENFIHPDDAVSTRAEVEKLRHGATTLAFENRYLTKDGAYRLLDWTAVPDRGRIHAVGRDITEQRLLARDRERIWTLSPVLKVVGTIEGQVQAVNPSWTKVLGWTADETIGHNIMEFVAPEDEGVGTSGMAQLAAGIPVIEYHNIFITKSGERRRIAWTTVPENGTLYGFGRDVTVETEAADALALSEEALRQSQKMEAVGQLTGGIAHDFNNLLQGITGSLELLQRRIAQGRTNELDRFISGATIAANRAAALTHRLLAFSRRQPLDPKAVKPNPLIASMEDMLRRTIGERIDLDLVLAGGLWMTLCDPNQLESAILNLVINARDAMPEGGKLTIETGNAHLDGAYASRARDIKPGQYICVSITDTGIGMTSETIARAFEPFFTTKPMGQGTGLGLSMIYGFARQSEGYAKIYSEVGTGTTFKLYLPRHHGAEDVADEVLALTEAHAAHEGEVVLVVEDEAVVRGLVVDVLTDLGYKAIEAVDGPKGLEILQSNRRIDLLITDIGLPGLNGRQVADAGRALRPGLKILFMTGYAENAALASGFLEPGMLMITKPFAMELLATRVRAIIEERS